MAVSRLPPSAETRRLFGEGCASRYEEGLRQAYGDCKIRPTKVLQHRESDANDLALLINQRTARATRRSLGVEDNFISEHVTDVSLRDKRMNQIAAREVVENF